MSLFPHQFDDEDGGIEELSLDIKNHIITAEEREELKLITNDYDLTWIDIKNSARFKTGILKDFEKNEIQYLINKERFNLGRKKGGKKEKT